MSSFAIAALVLVSAALHALWNALIKRERDVRAATLAVLTIAVAAVQIGGAIAIAAGAILLTV